jgi:hypothetical protein
MSGSIVAASIVTCRGTEFNSRLYMACGCLGTRGAQGAGMHRSFSSLRMTVRGRLSNRETFVWNDIPERIKRGVEWG